MGAMIGVGQGGGWRGALVASLVFSLSVALTVLLAFFLFRPVLMYGNEYQRDSRDEKAYDEVDRIRLGEGQVDSIDRPKYWGGGPVIGPAFNPQDPTRAVSLEDLHIRVPFDWGCDRTDPDQAGDQPGDKKLVCGLYPGEPYPGGVVTVRPCEEQPCDIEQERREARQREKNDGIPASVKRPDPKTAYIEWTETRDGKKLYIVGVSHFWGHDGSDQPNAKVIATFSGPVGRKEELQKIVNDVWDATS